LKLQYHKLLSNFAFNFNLRRYTVEAALLKDLGVSSFTSFSVTAARRHLLAGATAGPRRI